MEVALWLVWMTPRSDVDRDHDPIAPYTQRPPVPITIYHRYPLRVRHPGAGAFKFSLSLVFYPSFIGMFDCHLPISR